MSTVRYIFFERDGRLYAHDANDDGTWDITAIRTEARTAAIRECAELARNGASELDKLGLFLTDEIAVVRNAAKANERCKMAEELDALAAKEKA